MNAQSTQPNIVNLNVKNPYTTILSFLKYKGKNEGTKINYEKDINDFFAITRNKKIEQLTVEDLKYIMQDVVNYQETLLNLKNSDGTNKYKNKSINKKMSVVYNLFCYFKSNEYDVNPFAFKLDTLSEKDSKGSDYLSEDEIVRMIELAKTKVQGSQKSLFLKLSYITAVRLTALSNLTWGDIELNEIGHIISVYDKGDKLDEKYIGEELFQELKLLKDNHNKDEKIFTLSTRTFQDTVTSLAKELGFSNEKKKITFHSMRKSSGVHVYERTENVELTKQHMNHKSMEVTFKNYINIKRDFTQTGSYMLVNKNDDIDQKIDEIEDLEMLKKALKECSVKVKNEILLKLQG